MFNNASSLSAGDISQVNTDSYTHSGATTNVIKGPYSSNVEIKATVYNRSEVHQPACPSALKDLCGNIAAGALHNSSERCDAPKCQQETRVAVQADIFSWMTNGHRDSEPKRILWLTGPAGSGKTAIIGSLADTCQRQGQLAATFFFSASSGSPDRRSKQCFIGTLAYQLQQGRVLGDHIGGKILSAVGADPAIFWKRLEEQMEVLILGPLCSSQGGYDTSVIPNIIMIDGLDECDLVVGGQSSTYGRTPEHEQIEILSTLLQAIQDPSFPFKVIIASRPEHWIRHFFSSPTGAAHTMEIFLDKDIALLLRSKFAEIRRRYDHLPPSWPSGENIKLLVKNSSGQFVYAATVMRYIETLSKLPQVQLNFVLNLRVQDATNPFGPLDALNTKILLSSPLPDLTVLWLRAYQLLSSFRNR